MDGISAWSRFSLGVTVALVVASFALDARADLREPDPPASPLVPAAQVWSERAWSLEVMRGLTAVHVVVAPMSADATDAGLFQGAYRDAIEAKLRDLGVAVMDADSAPDGRAQPEAAVLKLQVDDVRQSADPDGHHDYWFTFELVQEVALVHHAEIRAPVVTWSRLSTGSHRRVQVAGAVAETLRQALDDFAREYRATRGVAAPATIADARPAVNVTETHSREPDEPIKTGATEEE